MKDMARSRSTRRGFTMLEMVLVLAVISILAALVQIGSLATITAGPAAAPGGLQRPPPFFSFRRRIIFYC